MAAAAETSLNVVFSRHLDEVRAFLAVRCRDADLAEELTQETAFRVTQAAPALNPEKNPGGYLVQVARNVWRDWLRKELVRRQAAQRLLANPSGGRQQAADDAVLGAELQAGLRRAIDALPRAQRLVVELRHTEGLTFQQIADRLHRPLGTVLGQMRTALQRMQQTMEAYR